MTFRAITMTLGCAVVAALFPVRSFAGGAVTIEWANDGALSDNASPFFADQAGTIPLTAGATNTVGDGAVVQLIALQGGTNYVLASATVGDTVGALLAMGMLQNGFFDVESGVTSNVLKGAVGSPMGVRFYNATSVSTATRWGIVSNNTITVPSPDWASPPFPVYFGLDFSDPYLLGPRTTAGGGFYTDTPLFTAAAGAYSGLVQSNTPSPETTGFINVTLANTGSFSTRLTFGSSLITFKGRFDNGGDYSTNLVTKLGAAFSITLHVDLINGTDQITGTVSGGSFTSDLIANRSVFNATTNPATQFQGYYTLFFLPDSAAADFPQGNGYGILTVDAKGRAKLKGTLGDGTKISQTAIVSRDGSWPVYIPLYAKKGLLSGWVTFTNIVGVSDLDGTLTWAKPSQRPGKFYPAGFTNTVTLEVAKYVAQPSGTPALDVTNAACNLLITLGSGNLSSVLSNSVTLDAANKVSLCAANGFKLTIVPTTGLFSGGFLNPATHKTTKFSGALSQKQNLGAGFFPGTNQTGFVAIEPSP
jgi:hypothetical protein